MLTPRNLPPEAADQRLTWCQFGLPGPEGVEFCNQISRILDEQFTEFPRCEYTVAAGYKCALIILHPRCEVTPDAIQRLNDLLAPFLGHEYEIQLYWADTEP